MTATSPAVVHLLSVTASLKRNPLRKQKQLQKKCLKSMHSLITAEICHFIHQLTCHSAGQIRKLDLSGSALGCQMHCWWFYLQCMWLLMKIINCSIRHVKETVLFAVMLAGKNMGMNNYLPWYVYFIYISTVFLDVVWNKYYLIQFMEVSVFCTSWFSLNCFLPYS